MSFASPWLLLFLLAVPAAAAVYVLLDRRRRRGAAAWASPALLVNMVSASPGRRRHVPTALFGLGVVLLLVGFARPEADRTVAREGATVVLTVDVSGSMGATDVQPTRLEAARAAAVDFVRELPSKYRVALVTFSDHATVTVPPTYDHDQISLRFPVRPQQVGTALGDAVATAVRVANRAVGKTKPGEPRPPATVLLLADGEQNAGRVSSQAAAARARQSGVPVFAVALGTPRGVVEQKIPGTDYVERIQVPVSTDGLRALGEATKGGFFEEPTPEHLKAVYEDLGSRTVYERKRREITVVFTAAALALMVGAAVASGLWFRRVV